MPQPQDKQGKWQINRPVEFDMQTGTEQSSGQNLTHRPSALALTQQQ